MNRDQRLLVERLRGQLVRHSYRSGHQTARRPVADDVPEILVVLEDDIDDPGVKPEATSRRGPTAVG